MRGKLYTVNPIAVASTYANVFTQVRRFVPRSRQALFSHASSCRALLHLAELQCITDLALLLFSARFRAAARCFKMADRQHTLAKPGASPSLQKVLLSLVERA